MPNRATRRAQEREARRRAPKVARMTEGHDHPHEHAEPAADGEATPGRQPRQARVESIIRNQAGELARANDNRVVLLALIDDLQDDLNTALVEVASLRERLEQYEPAGAPEAEAKAKAKTAQNGQTAA